MPSSYALRTVTSAETAFNKLTVSCWLKGHADGTQRSFWGIFDETSNNRFFHLYYSTNGSLYGYWKQNEGTFFTLGTTQKFRDPNAWFHFQMTMDTTLATASDRVKFYLNGERITSFEDSLDTASPFTQNATCNILGNTDGRMIWGAGKQSGTLYYWDRYMSHCHMCVGYAYDPTEFGSTDSVTGEWKINTSPSVLYGTNGGFWFKDSSALTDSSSNSNTLTVGGTLTNTEDCPSNVFATMNPLDNYYMNGTFSNGNLTVATSSAEAGYNTGTLGASSGKFYWEMKLIQPVSGTNYVAVGIAGRHPYDAEGLGYRADAVAYQGYDGQKRVNGSTSSYGSTWTTNDIIGIAMDLDNSKLYFSKNGTWQDSGDPTSGATGTGAISITAVGSTEAGFYFPAVSDHAGSSWTNAIFSFNFGNGFFGTTAITTNSGNGYAGAEGSSKFNYQPPTGYSALSTKGLNQ